jgi:hypothetical protein
MLKGPVNALPVSFLSAVSFHASSTIASLLWLTQVGSLCFDGRQYSNGFAWSVSDGLLVSAIKHGS